MCFRTNTVLNFWFRQYIYFPNLYSPPPEQLTYRRRYDYFFYRFTKWWKSIIRNHHSIQTFISKRIHAVFRNIAIFNLSTKLQERVVKYECHLQPKCCKYFYYTNFIKCFYIFFHGKKLFFFPLRIYLVQMFLRKNSMNIALGRICYFQ